MALTCSAVAVPPVRTGDATATQIAALEVGMVRSIPMITEITMPMTKGVALVAMAMSTPN